ncbi:hypothetical protein ACLESD_01835 [Pyxidicoccus sp. 3LFB2]
MSGPLLGQDTRARCPHGGQAVLTAVFPRVKLGGVPVVVQAGPFTVAGCPAKPPCVTGTFTVGATRVRAQGQPVLLRSSPSVCTPTGAALQILQTQTRGKGL